MNVNNKEKACDTACVEETNAPTACDCPCDLPTPKLYIGVKKVIALPMTAREASDKGYRVGQNGSVIPPTTQGYEVIYEDGYKSWSPKDVFDKAYRSTEGTTFGLAIEALKRGDIVARRGWNGKGMFLWLKPATTVKLEWCKDPLLKSLDDSNGGEIEALGTICMKTADGNVLTGWLASQTDILSEDWIIVTL